MQLNIKFPEKLTPLWAVQARYYILKGGRAGGKSVGIADYCIGNTVSDEKRVMCARETQNSMTESVHYLLCERIEHHNIEKHYKITRDKIYSHAGSEFFFKGLARDPSAIKSAQDVDICWIEEAHNVSYNSWSKLIPTIRNKGSKIIISFNPENETDETYQRFIMRELDAEAVIVSVNYLDNAMCPQEMITLAEHSKKHNPDEYNHIWLGYPKKISDAVVFKKCYRVEEFEANPKAMMRYGLDFGFNAPCAIINNYLENNKLYIVNEIYESGMTNRMIRRRCKEQMPGIFKATAYGDCSRPETIAELKNPEDKVLPFKGIMPCDKWKGCIEDGVAYLKNLDDIIIHPRCTNTIREFGSWSYKKNKNTDEILDEFEDDNNHAIDAVRYSLNREIMASRRRRAMKINPAILSCL